MKYVCFLYYDVEAFERLGPDEAQALGPKCRPHDQALKATGKLVVQASFSSPDQWFHFVPREGKPERRAGKYLGGKDQVGALLVIEAESPEEAGRVASKHAAANVDGPGFAVEVRACDLYETP